MDLWINRQGHDQQWDTLIHLTDSSGVTSKQKDNWARCKLISPWMDSIFFHFLVSCYNHLKAQPMGTKSRCWELASQKNNGADEQWQT